MQGSPAMTLGPQLESVRQYPRARRLVFSLQVRIVKSIVPLSEPDLSECERQESTGIPFFDLPYIMNNFWLNLVVIDLFYQTVLYPNPILMTTFSVCVYVYIVRTQQTPRAAQKCYVTGLLT
ncbi:unnamed protein product [Periconia digitata]|uniref:Uncharacterized protein n=1 Tax=Periconia digitata TaxID=1303443 RepID=A0A9W4XPK9_9PLEO|nr:unnamed protein product [Periconia digitata]